MARSALIGSRIRARRLALGMRQADLARRIGVSSSYLNLIEHNRRRAGPELVEAAAAALGADPTDLIEGGAAALLEALRSAAMRGRAAGTAFGAAPESGVESGAVTGAEVERIEEFVGRFPGWAGLIAAQERRLAALEHSLERLSDRMAHDPQLSEGLHEILSVAASVQSTATILAEIEDVPPDWQARFHGNLRADSERLAGAAQALVSFLETMGGEETGLASPQEELEAWLTARGFFLPELEPGSGAADTVVLQGARDIASAAARLLAQRHLREARAEAEALPAGRLARALARHGLEPAVIAGDLSQPLGRVLRRLAALPAETPGLGPVGLVQCDGSGAITFRRPLEGFALPRFGAGCPLWPLYQALVRPNQPLAARLEIGDRLPRRFRAWAVCEAVGPPAFDRPPVLRAVMLLAPEPPGQEDAAAPVAVGPTCRLCLCRGCPARREPSILGPEGAEAF